MIEGKPVFVHPCHAFHRRICRNRDASLSFDEAKDHTGIFEGEGGLIQNTLGFNDLLALNATFRFEATATDQAAYVVDAYDVLE